MVTFSLVSMIGNRDINEDSVGMFEKDGKYCFVLCDGLGGHGKGEIASELVCKDICEKFSTTEKSKPDFVVEAFVDSQKRLLELQNLNKSKLEMKTTAVVLLIDKLSAVWGHIGDSRLYMFRKNGKVKLRTMDHSVPQMLVMAKDIKEKEMRHHPDRNKLLSVLGNECVELKYCVSDETSLIKARAFLLCSDGFWENITEKEMSILLKKSKTVKEWIEQMEKRVLKNAEGTNLDNYSAICIFV